MKTCFDIPKKELKITTLNTIINNAKEFENTGVIIDMIFLSARAAIYLRNRNVKLFNEVVGEIDLVTEKYRKYSENFKMTC